MLTSTETLSVQTAVVDGSATVSHQLETLNTDADDNLSTDYQLVASTSSVEFLTSNTSDTVPWPPVLTTAVALAVVQWIVFFVGTAANVTVLVVLSSHRETKLAPTQLLLASLSLVDLVWVVVTGWSNALVVADSDWKLGVVKCSAFHTLFSCYRRQL